MKEQNNISFLMAQDHSRIEKLLDNFSKAHLEQKYSKMALAFDGLKMALEKHFNLEEEAIFKLIQPSIAEAYNDVPVLIKQHDQICEMMQTLKDELLLEKVIDVHRFRRALAEHKKFEADSFYPRLDLTLDKSQKEIVIKKLNQVI